MKWRDRFPKSSVVITAIVGLLVVLIALVLSEVPDSTVTVEVELTSSESGTAELFVNGDEQWQQGLVSAGRQTIAFANIEGPLDYIRIDPVAVAAARVTVHRVSVFDAKHHQLATFTGQAFATWANYNASDIVVDSDGLSFTTVTADTATTSAVDVETGGRSKILDSIVTRWRKPWPATELVLGLPIVLLALGAVLRRKWAAVALLIGPLALYLAVRLAGSTHGVTPADKAFGQPGFGGFDSSYPRRFLLITVLLVVGLSLLTLVIRRQFPSLRRTPARPAEFDAEQVDTDVVTPIEVTSDDGEAADTCIHEQTRPVGAKAWALPRLRRVQWVRVITILIVPLFYALIRFPSAHGISSTLSAPIATRDWDYANLRTWDHFLASGLQPMVDFWYPYGNLGYLRMGVIGAVADWIGEVICIIAFSASLWRLSQRATPVLIGTIAVAAFDIQFFTGGFRYLAPLAFATWFATTRRSKGVERWFALGAVAVTPLIASDVGAYTLAAALAVLVADELMVRGLGDKEARRRITRDGLAIASGLLGYVIVWMLRGGLGPSLDLILDEQTTSAYVGAIIPVEKSITEIPGLILYIFPFAALGVALCATLRRRGRNLSLSWIPALAGMGAFGVLVLAKHLIRPGLQGALAMICAASVAVAIAGTWQRVGSANSAAAAGALIGALFIQAQAGDNIERWRAAIDDSPSKAVELLAAATWDRDESVLYRTTITRGRMAAYPEELAAADAVAAIAPTGRIFVLGDAQYLYPIAGSNPYWTISSWETSPFDTQKRVLAEMEDDPPAVIVFDPRDAEFDGVASELRLPLIYQWVVERYSAQSSSGPYELFTPRGSDQDIDWAYWRTMLGTTLDMGRLPAATTASGASCELDDLSNDHCLAYLRLDVEPVASVVVRTITLSGPSGFFRLTFKQQPADRELIVPLGRMWFWTDDSSVFVPTDWVISHEMFGARDSVLY